MARTLRDLDTKGLHSNSRTPPPSPSYVIITSPLNARVERERNISSH